MRDRVESAEVDQTMRRSDSTTTAPCAAEYATAAMWKCERGRLDLSENGSMPSRCDPLYD
jgi:hypothetical protein